MAHAFQGMACPVKFYNNMPYAWSFNVNQFKWGWCPASWATANINWYTDIREVKDNELTGSFKATTEKKARSPKEG